MTDKIDDGGPAFPRAPSKEGEVVWDTQRGMSLHDWLAGQSLAGLRANSALGASVVAARLALDDADAMIAEKRRREGK